VTGNITLYAKWTETTKNYGISGKVYESNGTTSASGVSVKLMKGNTQVASTTSATDGTYSFTGIAPGVYNIVAEKMMQRRQLWSSSPTKAKQVKTSRCLTVR